jgi:hypothetical protein
MRYAFLLLMAVPLGGLLAQDTPIRVVITAPKYAHFMVRSPADSVPLVAQGSIELGVPELGKAGAGEASVAMQIAALDTSGQVHVAATQNGRVIASGDGAYMTVRRESNGISIEVKSAVPAAATRGLRRPH